MIPVTLIINQCILFITAVFFKTNFAGTNILSIICRRANMFLTLKTPNE